MALTFPTPMFDSTRSRITRTDPRRLANKTRHAQRIHENRIQDWKTIFITTGAPFLSCQKIIIYSRRILSISLFSWKKKKNTFLLKLYRFPRFRLVFIIECTARWPWRGRASPVVSIESSRKNGSPRNKVALRP